MNKSQTLKINNSRKKLKSVPLIDNVKILPYKGTPFTIKNIGSNNISIIVEKIDMNIMCKSPFNVSIEKWFGKNKIPDNVNKSDNVLDYFIKIHILKTEIPIQEKTFSSIEKYVSFLLNNEIYSIEFTGAIIPNLMDYNGITIPKLNYLDYSIDKMINTNNDAIRYGVSLQFD
jgi:hypothetical protein